MSSPPGTTELADFSLWPFGRTAIDDPTATKLGLIGAILWIIPGIVMAIGYVVSGVVMCVTIIGIPFQAFELAGPALQPFGKQIVRVDALGP